MGSSSAVPPVREVALFSDLRQRPELLLRELLWRWSCGGCLLALAAYDGWRIWTATLPALQVDGILTVTPDTVMQHPAQVAATATAAFGVLEPLVERAVLGLAPLMLFCWVCAFAWGRTAVLARYDRRLLRRPFLLAACEALRVCLACTVLGAWAALLWLASRLALRGDSPNLLLYVAIVIAGTVALALVWPRVARCLTLSMAIGLLEPLPFAKAYAEAWRLYHGSAAPQANSARKAARRARFILFLIVVVCTLFPAPFDSRWTSILCWSVLSLLPLVAADAAKLGILFTMIGVVRSLRAAPVDAL